MDTFFTGLLDALPSELNPWFLLALLLIPFFATLLLVPWLVLRLPEDYFLRSERRPMRWRQEHPALRLLLLLGKNLLGLLILLMGLAMLVLPGQGLLTILIGLLLLDFPGKFRCERWLVSRGPVLRSINWLRTRRGRPELRVS